MLSSPLFTVLIEMYQVWFGDHFLIMAAVDISSRISLIGRHHHGVIFLLVTCLMYNETGGDSLFLMRS